MASLVAQTARPHIAVVGAGVVGLTSALRLLQGIPGCSVTVLADRFGGEGGQQGKKAGAEEHSLPSPAGHWFLLLACEGKGGPFILSPSRGYGVPPSGA